MKIGCGVTTFNRPKHLELWKKQISSFFPTSLPGYYVETYIADDSVDRKGIAYRKNECLRALKDCDYIFMFDDDCFPIKEGWAELFINYSITLEQSHFMYLRETPTIKKIGKDGVFDDDKSYMVNIYNNCSGCMMFFTKAVIEKVGAYNPAYGMYGFEHAGYSNRIYKAGLTPLGAYTCPAGAGEYIYSLDMDNHLPFNRQLNHKPSMPPSDMVKSIEQNKAIYMEDTEIFIPL